SRRDDIQYYYIAPNVYSFDRVSCQDLIHIDTLWSTYSQDRSSLALNTQTWNQQIAGIDWKSSRNHQTIDAQKVNALTDQIRDRYSQLLKTDYSEISEGEIPSEAWLFAATIDGQAPAHTIRTFHEKMSACFQYTP
ncbi:MAG: hypothetical protein AAFX40_10540, partial [Cyanobacteria bacterium J06639_1]